MPLTQVEPYMVNSTADYTVGNLTITGSNVSLGNVANVHITGGANGQAIITDGSGNLSFTTPTNNARVVGYNLVFGG